MSKIKTSTKEKIFESIVRDLLEQRNFYQKYFADRRALPVARPPDPQIQYAYNSVLKTIITILKIWSPSTKKKDLFSVAAEILKYDFGVDRIPESFFKKGGKTSGKEKAVEIDLAGSGS